LLEADNQKKEINHNEKKEMFKELELKEANKMKKKYTINPAGCPAFFLKNKQSLMTRLTRKRSKRGN